MNVIPTEIPDVVLIEPKVFSDLRGYFFESYNEESFRAMGIDEHFMQDNQSKSVISTIRGLHFQLPPHEQGKLVRVVRGRIFDIAVDIRRGSPWYGQWVGRELSAENRMMLWIPAGFAHGFVVREDETIVSYKCTRVYHRESEASIRWNDPELAIDWGVENPVVSEKDSNVPFLADIESPFIYTGKK